MKNVRQFQERFRAWLGPNPEAKARIMARLSGYSLGYVRRAAGLTCEQPWPGSRRFVCRMAALGCTDRPWRDRPPEELRRAFREREVLVDLQREANGNI
jgi:hypothetical protein